MKKKKSDLLIIGISVIIIFMNNISLSKYDESMKCNVNSQIARAVVVLEKDECVKQQINQTSFPIEYNFSINNYSENVVNEVDFDYVIEVENSVDNFPVSYILFDCDNNKEIKIVNGKSEQMKISKFTKQSRKFKLYLQWRELDDELAENIQIKLKVNVVQSKKGADNEETKNSNNSNDSSNYVQ